MTLVITVPQNHIDLTIPADIKDFGIRLSCIEAHGAGGLANLVARVSFDGTSFVSDSSKYRWIGWHPSDGGAVVTDSFQLLPDLLVGSSCSTDASLFLNPGSSTKYATLGGTINGHVETTVLGVPSTDALFPRSLFGNMTQTGRVQTVRFYMDSGQISGRFTLLAEPGSV